MVNSEDLPLNVSPRDDPIIKIDRPVASLVTAKAFALIDDLGKKPEEYEKFWKEFGRYLKEGAAVDKENRG